MKYTLFLSCIRGFEEYCKQELQDLGIEEPVSVDGGIQFNGDLSDIYKINCSSRHGMYLYSEIAEFSFDEKKLYNNIYNISWDKYLNNIHSFAIKVNSTDRRLNSQYTALVIKDGIADYFTKIYGRRPNVEKRNPDIPIYAYIHNNHIKLYIDTSGAPLYKRGYRTNHIHEAPLNEVLAANIISSMTLNNQMLYDPMCGSGTLLIEAAMIANNIPANIFRNNFGFEKWKDFDPELFEKIKDVSLNKEIEFKGSITGGDNFQKAVRICRKNIENALMFENIKVKNEDFFETKINENTFVIFNPPYGERIELGINEFYKKIGDSLKNNYKNCIAWLISSDIDNLKMIGLKPTKKIELMNGNLKCSFREFKIYEGSKKSKKLV